LPTPPPLTVGEIDEILKEVSSELTLDEPPAKRIGQLSKAFYSKVDKSTIDSKVVSQRIQALLANNV
jgi:hypothetical protein